MQLIPLSIAHIFEKLNSVPSCISFQQGACYQANIIQNIFKTYAYYNTISLNINHMISPQLEDPELRVCGYDMTMGVQKAF